MSDLLSQPLGHALVAAYYAVLLPLALLGLHRLVLVVLLRRAERGPRPGIARDTSDARPLPTVTVQLPIFNEPRVASRVLDAVSRFDYPRDRLEIQVLDDSTDDTTARLARQVDRLRASGLDVKLLHRGARSGYKAGALEAGLREARGDLVAIFDADFTPPPDFLRRTVPAFDDPAVGLVQARWGHLNRSSSLLTRVQALLLDGHFLVEHAARAATARFFNFNGTAGVWRRRTIEDAGGWQHDTLTEDLDLSYRAQLRGWRFVLLASLVAPAELPGDLPALRSQQRRWTRGSAQCLRKLLGPLWAARLPPARLLEATIHLASNLSHPLMVGLAVLLFPAMWARHAGGVGPRLALDCPILIAATGSVAVYYLEASRRAGGRLGTALALQPALMALGLGMSWHNARAALGGLVRRGGVFERTPKLGTSDRRRASSSVGLEGAPGRPPIGETLLSLYLATCWVTALLAGLWLALPFLSLFLCGYLWVAFDTWRALLAHRIGRSPVRLRGAEA